MLAHTTNRNEGDDERRQDAWMLTDGSALGYGIGQLLAPVDLSSEKCVSCTPDNVWPKPEPTPKKIMPGAVVASAVVCEHCDDPGEDPALSWMF